MSRPQQLVLAPRISLDLSRNPPCLNFGLRKSKVCRPDSLTSSAAQTCCRECGVAFLQCGMRLQAKELVGCGAGGAHGQVWLRHALQRMPAVTDRQQQTLQASGFFAGEFTRNGRFQRHQRRREESSSGKLQRGRACPIPRCVRATPPGLLGGGGPQHTIVAPTDCDFRDGSLMIARPSALPRSSLWGSCVRSCVQKVQSCCNQKVKTWESCRAIHHHHHHHLVWVCE